MMAITVVLIVFIKRKTSQVQRSENKQTRLEREGMKSDKLCLNVN